MDTIAQQTERKKQTVRTQDVLRLSVNLLENLIQATGNPCDAESRKNVLLIHTLPSVYCALSKHCSPFVFALNLAPRQAIPMYFPVIKK